jgi:hypothetical protein
MLYRVYTAWAGFELATLVVIGTDCIGSTKSNYHTNHDHDGPVKKTETSECSMQVIQYHRPQDERLSDCPVPVKTDVEQIVLGPRLSNGTSKKMTGLPFEGYFL